jgi:hypothetical protein
MSKRQRYGTSFASGRQLVSEHVPAQRHALIAVHAQQHIVPRAEAREEAVVARADVMRFRDMVAKKSLNSSNTRWLGESSPQAGGN